MKLIICLLFLANFSFQQDIEKELGALPGEGKAYGPPGWSGAEGSGPGYPVEPHKPLKCIPTPPKKLVTAGLTPFVNIMLKDDSAYICDFRSYLSEIRYNKISQSSITCYGIKSTTTDDTYDLVFKGPYPQAEPMTATITNYTQITSYSNGNSAYTECGLIANGPCAGDTLQGYGYGPAIDEDGCSEKKGNSGYIWTSRTIIITGKCESTCQLGRSDHYFNPKVNNLGAGQPNPKFDVKHKK